MNKRIVYLGVGSLLTVILVAVSVALSVSGGGEAGGAFECPTCVECNVQSQASVDGAAVGATIQPQMDAGNKPDHDDCSNSKDLISSLRDEIGLLRAELVKSTSTVTTTTLTSTTQTTTTVSITSTSVTSTTHTTTTGTVTTVTSTSSTVTTVTSTTGTTTTEAVAVPADFPQGTVILDGKGVVFTSPITSYSAATTYTIKAKSYMKGATVLLMGGGGGGAADNVIGGGGGGSGYVKTFAIATNIAVGQDITIKLGKGGEGKSDAGYGHVANNDAGAHMGETGGSTEICIGSVCSFAAGGVAGISWWEGGEGGDGALGGGGGSRVNSGGCAGCGGFADEPNGNDSGSGQEPSGGNANGQIAGSGGVGNKDMVNALLSFGFKIPRTNAGYPTSRKGAVSNGGTGGAGISIDTIDTPAYGKRCAGSAYASGGGTECCIPSKGWGGGGSGGYGDAGGGANGQIISSATNGFAGVVAIKWD